MIAFFKDHRRAIALLVIFAWAALPLIQERALGLSANLFTIAVNLIFLASQLFWFRRVGELGEKLIASTRSRIGLGAAGLIAYAFFCSSTCTPGRRRVRVLA
jgi:hypothetical protein